MGMVKIEKVFIPICYVGNQIINIGFMKNRKENYIRNIKIYISNTKETPIKPKS